MTVIIPQALSVFGGHYFGGLPTTERSARESGNEPVVLEPEECPAVDEFRKHFHPVSFPAPLALMHWWFEQWLLIDQWMERQGAEVVFKIDSDVLIFENLQELWESLGKPPGNLPTASSFVTRHTASVYRDYILSVFRAGTAERLCEGSVLGDDGLLQPLARQLGFPHLGHHPHLCVDSNMYLGDAADLYQGHKDIWFVNGHPIYRRGNQVRRCVSLHCWGPGKAQIESIYEQSRLSLKGSPVRLSVK